MKIKQSHKIIFWIALTLIFLISGGQVLSKTIVQTADHSDLIINEFVAANASGITDENGDHSDWIEIYNRSNHAVNLGGWSLTDDPGDPDKWTFPDMNLGSDEYLLVFASGKNRKDVEPGAVLHTNFKLNRQCGFLALHNVLYGRFMDSVSPQKPEQVKDVAFGRRSEDLEFGYLIYPTPGVTNNDTFVPQEIGLTMEYTIRNSEPAMDDTNTLAQALVESPTISPLSEQQVSQLKITEIMYHPTDGDDYEFIELKNAGSQPLDVSGVSFEGIEFTFPLNSTPMAPDELLVLVRNESEFSRRYPGVTINGIYEGQLSNQGEPLVVRDITGNIVTTVAYDDELGWPISPDGWGDSLVLVTPYGVPSNPKNWRASTKINGSPGVDHQVAIASK